MLLSSPLPSQLTPTQQVTSPPNKWRRNAETGRSSWGPWAAQRAIPMASLRSVTHRLADTPRVSPVLADEYHEAESTCSLSQSDSTIATGVDSLAHEFAENVKGIKLKGNSSTVQWPCWCTAVGQRRILQYLSDGSRFLGILSSSKAVQCEI